jgi:hypothetical protein
MSSAQNCMFDSWTLHSESHASDIVLENMHDCSVYIGLITWLLLQTAQVIARFVGKCRNIVYAN